MRFLLVNLVFLVSISFAQEIEVTLGETRSVPQYGFNGNTLRGPSWINPEFTDSVATMQPDILRYPAGAAYWDWSTGWFLEAPAINDTILIDTLPNNWITLPQIDIRPIHFQNALNVIDAEGIFIMNMITTDLQTSINSVYNAMQEGVVLNHIELGSEINHINDSYFAKYPTAGDYARDCQVYLDSLSVLAPNARFTLSAGNRGDNERSAHWNDSLYAFIDSDSCDALTWHVYLYMKDTHADYTDRQFISYPYFDIPRYEDWRGFQDTTTQIQNHEIWVTEYNMFDKSEENIYRNTWLHSLFLSAMTDNLMNNNLITMLLAHNVGGPTGFDAINNDEDEHFQKRATAFSTMLYDLSSKNMTEATKLEFPVTLSDTITYYTGGGNPKQINCPRLFGWKFNNDTKETGIITNVSDSTISVSINNAFNDQLLWTHWTTDTLRAEIHGYDSVNREYVIGSESIAILPFSMNTFSSIILGDVNQDNILNVLDIIEEVNVILGYSIFSDKQIIIGDVNTDGSIDISDILAIVERILN